jgi:hypothetical protein
MMREENGARSQTFTYTAGTAAGKARTLATPPKLEASSQNELES